MNARLRALMVRLAAEPAELIFWGWGVLLTYISFVPAYYLPPVSLRLGGFEFEILKYLPAALALGTAFLFALLCRFRLPLLSLQTPLLLLVLLNGAIEILSLFKASYPLWGATKWLYFSATGILVYLLSLGLNEPKVVRVLKLSLAAGTLVAGYGILEYLLGENLLYGSFYTQFNPYYSKDYQIASTIGINIALGAYLVALLPFSWYLLHGARRRVLCYLVTAFITLALLLTYARSAWLALLAASLVYALGLGKGLVPWLYKRRIQVLIVGLSCLSLSPVLQQAGVVRLFNQHRPPGLELEPRVALMWGRLAHFGESENFRLAQYGTALRVVSAHPLLGVGFGNFTRLFDQYKSPDTPALNVRTTENMYLMVVCETGLTGLLAFLLLLGGIWWHLWRNCQSQAGPGKSKLPLAFLASYSGLLFNMAFWDALNFPALRVLFWMIAGMGMALALRGSPALEGGTGQGYPS